MFAQERWNALLDLLRRRGRLSVRQVEQAIGASPATVRRDLAALARAGELVRTHGGVVHPSALRGEPVFQKRARVAVAAKDRIGQRAADEVPPNAVVFIDAGTTTLALARRLVARRDVRLFTNSLPVLLLAHDDGAAVCVPGGQVRPPSQSLVGGLALDWLPRLRFDLAFLGASGLDPREGPSATSIEETALKQAAIRRSRRKVLLADASKWDRPAAFGFASWADLDLWITDRRVSPSQRRAMSAPRLQIIEVRP